MGCDIKKWLPTKAIHAVMSIRYSLIFIPPAPGIFPQ
jgi:hypothetical protein